MQVHYSLVKLVDEIRPFVYLTFVRRQNSSSREELVELRLEVFELVLDASATVVFSGLMTFLDAVSVVHPFARMLLRLGARVVARLHPQRVVLLRVVLEGRLVLHWRQWKLLLEGDSVLVHLTRQVRLAGQQQRALNHLANLGRLR